MAKKTSASNSVSKSMLVAEVARQLGVPQKQVKAIVEQFFADIIGHLDQDRKVQLSGFGSFEVRERRARRGVKPGTTEPIDIPAGRYAAFKASQVFRERLADT